MKKKYSKVIVWIIVIAAIIALGAYFYKNNQIKQDHLNEINSYKKGFYNSIYCEFNCPLTLQIVNNKTNRSDMVPDKECLKNCTEGFIQNVSYKTIPQIELQNDHFLNDTDLLVNNCRRTSVNLDSNLLNSTKFFSCVEKNLYLIKAKYRYL